VAGEGKTESQEVLGLRGRSLEVANLLKRHGLQAIDLSSSIRGGVGKKLVGLSLVKHSRRGDIGIQIDPLPPPMGGKMAR